MAANFTNLKQNSEFWADSPQPPQHHRGGVALGEGYPDTKRFAASMKMP